MLEDRRDTMNNLLVNVAWIGIISLIIINLFIVFFTVIINQKDRLNKKSYQKAHQQIQPIIKDTINDPSQLIVKLNFFKTKIERQAIFHSLMNHAQKPETTKNSLQVLERLGFLDELIKGASKKLSLRHIQLFSQLRLHKSFSILMKGTTSKNYEIGYNSFYALSLLPLSEKELPIYIEAVLKSSIMRDRIVDMLNHLHIEVEKILYFLEKVTLDKDKVILLLVLRNRLKKHDSLLANQLLPYLKGTKEVRIATIHALAASGNEFYFPFFQELYKNETDWQVRAVISKNLSLLNAPGEQELLTDMLKDENWWVRHNAMDVLKKRYPNHLNFEGLENGDQSTQLKTKVSGTK